MRRNVGSAPAVMSGRFALLAVLGLLASVLTLVTSPSIPTTNAADPVCTISAKLVNSCRPWFGAESGNSGVGSGFRTRMLEHEARIGRQVDIVHAYTGPGAVLSADMVTLAKRPATIALINWKPSYTWANADGRNATVNTQIDTMARSIKALDATKIMLTVYHEPEREISSGGAPSCPTMSLKGSSGSTADYVNMWHNVRHRFDALGVDNVVWVMNYTGYVTWHCLTKDLWPGNDYVDWLMWDPYPKDTTWTATVGSFYNYLTANSDAEHDFLSKPWGLGEFGYLGTNQTRGYAMYDEARRNVQNGVHPKLKAYVVWDNYTSSSYDNRVRFTSNHVADPVEQEHYIAFANDSNLMGAAVPEPTDRTPPVVTATSPEDGATVGGTVPVTGSASDEEGVESVDLLVDGDAVLSSPTDADGAVSFDWNSLSVASGTHTLRLRASDAAGNVGQSGQVSVTVGNTDTEAPTPPPALSGTWSRPSQAALTWSGSSDNGAVTGYRIYRDDVLLATVGPNVRSHSDAGLENLTTYIYKVTALDAAGNESEPSEVSVYAGDDTPPSTPTAVFAELAGTDGASVSWSPSNDNVGVDAYRVYRNGTLLTTLDGATYGLLDEGLDDGVAYSYRVVAVDAVENASDPGGPASVTVPDQTAPTAPVELKAISTSQSVALSWKAATDNVAVKSYVVYRDGMPLTSMSSSVTSFTDNALIGNSAHQYYVKAFDTTDNEGPASNTVTRSFADTTAPTAPSGLARTLSGFTVRLTWRASTDNVGVQSYTVYRGGVAVGTSSTLAYTDSTAPTGKTSTYTVRARDAAGNLSAASGSVSAAVPPDSTAPTAPTGLRATAGTKQIVVAWNASSDNVGVKSYQLFRANVKYRLLGKVTSFTDTGLVTGTKYTYKVVAIDTAGNWSGASGNISAIAK
jgi:fibronectin type 3 domain-containing protein